MKKLFFTALVCLGMTGIATAQFEQGTLLVSGKTGLNLSSFSVKAKDDGNSTKVGNQTSFSFSPAVGFFAIDNLAIGAMIDATTEKTKSDFGGEDYIETSTSFTVGPFARYYLPQGIYGELALAVGAQTDKEKFDGETDEEKYGLFGWSLTAGYAFLPWENIAIEPSLGYGSMSMKPDGGDGKLVTSGLLIGVGISLYLGK